MKPLCVVLSGAGISAESGIPTYRAADGLWAGHKIEEVCTLEALQRNRQQVLDFYNERRRNCAKAKPNAAHSALVELERAYHVQIITQNVDDLHERSGSANVLHLHGELTKARSSFDPDYIVPCAGDQSVQDKDPNGHPMRPHIVFFGENVPMLEPAIDLVSQADIVLVIGTSLQVYPANGLVNEAPKNAQIYLIDPNPNTEFIRHNVNVVKMKAGEGVPKVVAELLEKAKNG
ncbi:SIR2 family NAD-dependent protein deacylase [Aggregatibacter actinomycetemcomitans]|uniref:SIR2 family NAD-dependent protein deacylase n=1 Tax=Aggregatibacter actinomycetemcomitans TaxID=714 RepID=UPI00197B7B2A|nr:NAD-dependent deacylase [Aggregatibacter actinomycetemcomitans]MBN6063502.1 NAD-dependent deacylase [Aggregatibacter actinomycetemcomitans]MBN6083385.1 NAD-dependent deacylase [Aggregatibacter actinomycetemcomitans]